MNVCAAIVTYTDRFHLLEKVINRCLEEKIDQITIVENGCSENAKRKLKQLSMASNIHVKWLGKNYGSAVGFKTALEFAYQQNPSHILILDDDNLIEKGSLEKLKNSWHTKLQSTASEDLALLCFRKGRQNFESILTYCDGEKMLVPRNNFMGFHIQEVFYKLSERLPFLKKTTSNKVVKEIKVPAAPYSGLFFAQELLNKYPLPNTDFVLYQDDFDFTLEFTSRGGTIWLLPHCQISDLENSEYLPTKKPFLYHSALDGNKITMFYSFRNMVFLSKKWLITNAFYYQVNQFLFWTLIGTMAILKGKTNRLKMLRTAAKSAKNNQLGIHPNYPLS